MTRHSGEYGYWNHRSGPPVLRGTDRVHWTRLAVQLEIDTSGSNFTSPKRQSVSIAKELEKHAGEELSHAIQIAKQIDYFNGTPVVTPREVKMSREPDDMLHFDLDNERETIQNYRRRIRQAEAMGEFGLSEVLREIIAEEQEHLTDLADALGIDNPTITE